MPAFDLFTIGLSDPAREDFRQAAPRTVHPETLRAVLADYLGVRAKAERELDWRPRGIDEGLAQTVAHLRGQP